MELAIDKAIDVLAKYSENEMTERENELLIEAIAELHQVRCKINVSGLVLPINYSLQWAKACIFLQNEKE